MSEKSSIRRYWFLIIPMNLNDVEKEILNGGQGEARRLALAVIVELGTFP